MHGNRGVENCTKITSGLRVSWQEKQAWNQYIKPYLSAQQQIIQMPRLN